MADELERLHAEDGFEFNAMEARLRCMPHTVHLSALEVGCKKQHSHLCPLIARNLAP